MPRKCQTARRNQRTGVNLRTVIVTATTAFAMRVGMTMIVRIAMSMVMTFGARYRVGQSVVS